MILKQLINEMPKEYKYDISPHSGNVTFNKSSVFVADHTGMRLGDKIALTAIGASECIKCVTRDITNGACLIGIESPWFIRDKRFNTGISLSTYLSHFYNLIIQTSDQDAYDALIRYFNETFPPYIMSDSRIKCDYIWEHMPKLYGNNMQCITMNGHEFRHHDVEWDLIRRENDVSDYYVAFHALTDCIYHPAKNMSRSSISRLLRLLDHRIAVVLVGWDDGSKYRGSTIYDMRVGNSGIDTIDQSLAIIRNSMAFFGGDSGLAHAAGAMGKRVVQVYPGNEKFHNILYDARPHMSDARYARIFMSERGDYNETACYHIIMYMATLAKGEHNRNEQDKHRSEQASWYNNSLWTRTVPAPSSSGSTR